MKLNGSEGNEKVLLLDYRTRFDSTYKKKLRRKLSGIGFKRCTGLTLTTDLNQYPNIISATRSLKKGGDMVLKCLKRELDRSHKMREQCANGEISEQAMDEYMRECPFDLRYGIPPESKELKYLCVLEFSLGDEEVSLENFGKFLEDVIVEKKKGHGAPHLHILLDNVFLNMA